MVDFIWISIQTLLDGCIRFGITKYVFNFDTYIYFHNNVWLHIVIVVAATTTTTTTTTAAPEVNEKERDKEYNIIQPESNGPGKPAAATDAAYTFHQNKQHTVITLICIVAGSILIYFSRH